MSIIAVRSRGRNASNSPISTSLCAAAMTAVATRALARPDSQVLGLIGAGGLAEPHIRAIRSVLPIRTVVAWSRTRARSEELLDQLDGLEVVVVDSPEQVARLADVICTLTPSAEPVLEGAWLRPGTHVIGWNRRVRGAVVSGPVEVTGDHHGDAVVASHTVTYVGDEPAGRVEGIGAGLDATDGDSDIRRRFGGRGGEQVASAHLDRGALAHRVFVADDLRGGAEVVGTDGQQRRRVHDVLRHHSARCTASPNSA